MKTPPKRSLWQRLNTPIYLRRYYRPWMTPVLGLMTVLAMVYGFWWLRANNPVGVQMAEKPDEQIGLRFYDVELRGRKEGTPFFTIMADEVEVSRDQRYVTFLKKDNKPRGEFYNLKDWEREILPEAPPDPEATRRSARWTASRAEYDTRMQDLKMTEGVEIVTDLEDVILTDEMIWRKQDETLSSSTRTKVRTHKKTYLESDQLKFETRDKALFLEGRVFIEMKLGKDQGVNVDELD